MEIPCGAVPYSASLSFDSLVRTQSVTFFFKPMDVDRQDRDTESDDDSDDDSDIEDTFVTLNQEQEPKLCTTKHTQSTRLSPDYPSPLSIHHTLPLILLSMLFLTWLWPCSSP